MNVRLRAQGTDIKDKHSKLGSLKRVEDEIIRLFAVGMLATNPTEGTHGILLMDIVL